MSSRFYFSSSKIKIEEFRDIPIETVGKYKTELRNNKKVIVGTGIYDKKLFNEVKKKNKENAPSDRINFYIKLNAKSPSKFSDYSIFGMFSKKVKNFLEYNAFYYAGEIITEEQIKTFDFIHCNDDLFYFGEEACIEYIINSLDKRKKMTNEEKLEKIEIFEKWFESNNTNYFLIADYSLREPKLINKGKKVIDSELNELYKVLFEVNENNSLFFNIQGIPGYLKFFSSRNIYKAKLSVEEGLFNHLTSGKKSLVRKEGVAEKLSGAIRGTIVPNPFIKEDQIEIGTMFANYLYPEFIGLWNSAAELNWLLSRGVLDIPKEIFRYDPSEWMTEDELISIKKKKNYEDYYYYYPWWPKNYSFIPEDKIEGIKMMINKRRMDYYKANKSNIDYMVLVDRNPTISQLSMFSARPIFRDSIGYSIRDNGKGKKLKNISSYNINSFKDFSEKVITSENEEDHDLDFYPEDVIAVNTLVCDGMNADFDGDILLVVALYSRKANIEAKKLFASLNYVSIDSGNIRNKIPKEFMIAMKRIYEESPELASKIHNIIERSNKR